MVEAVAQFATALLLELCHHVGKHSDDARSGNWAKHTDFCYWLNPLVELSTDLQGSWTSAADPLNSTIAVTPGPTEDTLTVTIPKAGNVRMFARLRVTQP